MNSKTSVKHAIVLMDGVCNLCQGVTRFIIRRDKRGYFRFASLQSDLGQNLLAEGGLDLHTFSSFVLFENGHFYTRSKAALRLVRHLPWPWPLLWIGVVIPPFLRDAIYEFIARHRYQWFGQSESCMLPTAETKDRFLS
ncbi:putative DCC family thiol-disulfide oxidoreductase YuxK [Paenibacillus shirakamiensis]|uniref:DCC family thiol-disulfide oxidoreductase YuxK n=1 Tax=Paenibacillus shirakamiensis TaxID=1265935 RepID=A0ABS4JHW6_9BACL|nr:thiol-disulfide oxidoreductase DCC family protein [Paenibacillus shirakamiensis]MBP2000561.1 putative DCC family thiol-disulfide oxidoreductase YuxK [Paenibacillus shirakamiensis]